MPVAASACSGADDGTVAAFREHGFVHLQGAVDAEGLASFETQIEELLQSEHKVSLADAKSYPAGSSRRVVEVKPDGRGHTHWERLASAPGLVAALNAILGKDSWQIPLNFPEMEVPYYWYCPITFPEDLDAKSKPATSSGAPRSSLLPNKEWSSQEDTLLLSLKGQGLSWVKIVAQLPAGRSATQCADRHYILEHQRPPWTAAEDSRLAVRIDMPNHLFVLMRVA
jgi:hypothetical protein